MKKTTKLFIIFLIIGVVGLAAMLGAVIGTGMMYSRETTKSYAFDEMPSAIKLETVHAQVSLVASDECRVEAYAKAWRPEEIDMDTLVNARMEGGELAVTEKPFANDFIGFFPQPYEMKLTVYAPQSLLDTLEGDMK
jgi:hypothetical protein